MALIASGKTGDFEVAPMGPQQAVCAFVEDIGTQENTFNGETKRAHQIVIVFELAEKKTRGDYAGQPFTLSNFYTLSLHEKSKLSKDLEAWFGKKFTPEQRQTGFDLEKLVGHNCLLNVVEYTKNNGDITARIGGVMPLPKNMTKIPVTCQAAPEWIAEQRSKSLEAKEAGRGDCSPAPNNPFDLPF